MRHWLARLVILLLAVAAPARVAHVAHLRIDRSDIVFTVNPDQTYTETETVDRTLLTTRGIQACDRSAITYYPDSQTLEVLEAWVDQPDGTRLQVGPENRFTRPSAASESAPGFTGSLTTTVVYPQLRPGSRTHVSFRRVQTTPPLLGFNVWSEAEDEDPVLEDRVTIDLPADLAPGTTLRDILTLQAGRGDFGPGIAEVEVASRLDRFYREVPTVKERVTSTDRTLQIRRRAMPDGAIVSVYSDITEIKLSERKLIQARSQAELANRSKSEFLANMSHELRTPLNAVIGFSEIISNELFGPVVNEKYLEYIKDIHSSSLHLLSIINDVLDMSKIEAGKLELSKEVLNIQSVIGEVMRMVRERAQRRGIELVAELMEEEVDIWADERAMKQIFLNLFSNAIKFSRPGGKIYLRVFPDQSSLTVLEIEDHGIGMSEEEQERALQPFGQAKPATTRNYGGTGLGLPITKGLVEAHGGTLTLVSRAGEGTTVRIVMPTERKRFKPAAE